MFKKALSILLALMLIVSSISITAISVSAADGDQEVTYTVAGSSAAMFGSTWDATNTANDMTFDEDSELYEITYSAVEPENAIQLKVVKNHAWEEAWGDKETGDNYTFNVVTACDVTVTFDPDTQEVNVIGDGVTQDTTLDVNSVIAVGNGEETYLNGVNWDPSDTSNAMEEDPENPGVWKMTMEDIYAFDNYNIKFAINSIDDNGNPTSNPWAHNFGSEVEQLYPTGEDIDAVYNGKNCIFEVEEDGSTVELTLDLRNFDFKTKKGAKLRIDVTAPEAPTDAPDETTVPVETDPVAETTVAPAPAGDGLTVNATSNLFTQDTQYYAEAPDTVTVTYYMDVDKALQLQAIQFGISYDSEFLTFDPEKNGVYDEDLEDYDYSDMFPVANGVGDVNPKLDENVIKFAVAKWDGLRLRKSGELIPIATVTFDVVDGAKGVTDVDCKVAACSLTNPKTEEDYIIYNVNGLQQEAYDFVTGGDPATLYTVLAPEGTEPPTDVTEPTTEEPVTEAPTTEAPTTEAPTTEEPTTEAPTTEAPTTEPTPDDAIYTVAGSSAAIFGSTWDATNAANDMTLGDDGIWTITYTDVQPEAAIQLKVLKNHSWDEAWGDKETGDNYTFNVDTACDVTVSFDPATETVTVTGEGVSQDTSLDVYSVIAVGNGEDTYLNGANWDPCDPANAMTEVSDGIWEMTMEDIYAFDNYNIKFAVNSVDADGNPTTNPWAHNFGSEVEQLYPTGEALDAVYNGKNCIFEVEEDGSTVKLQLDLRDFDFKTKKGAKMTITVEAPSEEPTTEEPVTEPGPVGGDSLTVNATSNLFTPDQATYYYTSEEGVPETVTVTYYMDVDKALQLQAIQFGISYDSEFLTFDPEKNGVYDEDLEEYDYSDMFPVANGVGDVNPKLDENVIKFAVAKWDGLRLRKSGELIPIATVTFDVVDGAKGVTDVDCKVAACAFTNPKTEEDYVIYNVNGLQQEAYDFVTGGDPSTLYAVIEPAGNTPIEPPTGEVTTEAPTTEEPTTEEPTTEEPTTEEPTTEAPTTEAPTTEAPTTEEPVTEPGPIGGDSLTINATSNLFTPDQATYYYTSEEGVPETVTVTYYMDVDKALQLQAIQFGISYDPEFLTFDPEKNGVYDEDLEDYDYSDMFPVANGVGDVNPMPDKNIIKFAVAKWDGLRLRKSGELIPIATVTFDVVDGAKGVTDVDCKVAACSLTNPKTEEDYIIYNVNGLQQEAYDFVTGGDPSTLYAVIEPAGNQPSTDETEAPTTEEPTTEAPTTEQPSTDGDDMLHVTATSNYFAGSQYDVMITDNGGSVTVEYYPNDNTKLDSTQWTMTYDPEMLTLTQSDGFMPQIADASYNVENGMVRGAASFATNPVSIDKTQPFASFTFVGYEPGETTVDLKVIVFEEHEDEEPTTEQPTTEQPTTEQPTTEQPTTEQPTTEQPTTEQPTTEAPGTDLSVTSTSNMFPTATQVVKVGDTVIVEYKFDQNYDLDSFQWTFTYDETKLQLTGLATPGVEDLVSLNTESGKVRGAASNATDPMKYVAGDTFVNFVFTALESGDTDVNLNVQVFEEHEDEEPTTEEPTTEQPTTEEPTTEEPTTEQPTTEETTTEQPTTEQPTTEQPTTEQPTTEQPTTEQPTTEQPTTEQPTTEQPTTEQPTTEQPTTEQPTDVTTPTGATESTDVTSATDSTASTDVTSSTDSTSSTDQTGTTSAGDGKSTPDSGSGSSSSSGAVQTGSASMAIIILLVLVSATAGIYFARKRREDK